MKFIFQKIYYYILYILERSVKMILSGLIIRSNKIFWLPFPFWKLAADMLGKIKK
jgi:hypothetical protein